MAASIGSTSSPWLSTPRVGAVALSVGGGEKMRKLSTGRGGGEKVGMLAFEVAALMSRAASLWRALQEDQVARLRGEGVRLEGVRRLVADDDAALLALALAEMAGACGDLSCAVARLSGRCADPLLRRFDALFAGLVAGGTLAHPHGLRYAAAKKMDRKAGRRLVAATGLLCEELDVLAELEQAARLRRVEFSPGQAARRVARQKQEVDRLRGASLCNRSLDYAVRLLGRSGERWNPALARAVEGTPATRACGGSCRWHTVVGLGWGNREREKDAGSVVGRRSR